MEFNNGSNSCIIGNTLAEDLFGTPERAVGKQIELGGKKINIVGTIKKEGKNFVGWDYDNCIMLSYKFAKQLVDEENSNPVIIVKGYENVTTTALSNELQGIMRQVRRLAPRQEDNFSLNSVEAFSKAITDLFGTVNIVGGLIGIISLIVGMFGIANIMFVSVAERTHEIGIRKAVGARHGHILTQFLVEAVLLSVLGGLLLENSAWDRIADLITEADFYRADHRLIYRHISKLVANTRLAIDYCLTHPRWRLSIQTHKYLGIA